MALLCASVLYAADPETLVRQVAAYDYGKNPAAVRELETLVRRSGASLEKLLLDGLSRAQTVAAKDMFCRQLAIVGTESSVPSLAAMLVENETAEMSRSALEQIPGDRAAAELRRALTRATPPIQAGIVTSLGRRRDAGAINSLRPLLGSGDARVAAAAAAALGRIGTPAARDALLAARSSPSVSDALLAIAEQSSAADAVRIYQHLGPAGLAGLARVAPAQAAPRLWEALKGGSAALQAVAIRALADTAGLELARQLPSLPVLARQRAISALADTAREEFRPVILESAGSDSEPVRIAALNALAKLGTAGEIPLLAGRAAETSGDEQAAARGALAAIRGAPADNAIVQAIPSAGAKSKLELIRAAGERGIAAAADALVAAAGDADRQVRLESLRALRETAGPAQVEALLGLLRTTTAESDRRETERAIGAAIRRSPQAEIAGVLRAYETADARTRVSLLNVFSGVGNPAALPKIRDALRDPAAEIARAALNSLSGWPTPEPLDEMLTLARTAADPARQTLALRGYIRLLQLPSSRTPAETAALLRAAMAAATRADEKRSVLAVAQRIITPESLALAQSALNDPQVKAEAQVAVTTLERGLAFVK